MTNFNINQFVDLALMEDIGEGDHTTLATISNSAMAQTELKIKSHGIVAGIEIAQAIAKRFDEGLRIQTMLTDGDEVNSGDIAFKMEGRIRSILSIERLILNVMQRMSGIATQTKEYVELIKHTKAKILDTRKTTPGFRWFEKEAVRIGGGVNHRFGLFDMILIKDNHIDGAGGVVNAIDKAIAYRNEKKLTIPIEVEVRNITELEDALNYHELERIMLDNFSIDETKSAVDLVGGKLPLESSGGINKSSISHYAETGVDFISVGALTHQFQSLDLSLKINS